MKALHPSDPTATVDGIPDESAVPSLHLGYQTTQTIYAPADAVSTWGCDMSLLPHPIAFSSFKAYDSLGTHTYYGTHVNTQLDGVSHRAKMNAFLQTAQRWRLAYMSATVYQDAAALTNQGTVAACQYAACPMIGSIDQGALDGSPPYGNSVPRIFRLATSWRSGDTPNFEKAQNMPNAYFGNSRDGVYMPLKLTRTCQRWRSEADCYVNGGLMGCTQDTTGGVLGISQASFGGGESISGMLSLPDYVSAFGQPLSSWPFWGGDGLLSPINTASPTEGVVLGSTYATSELCNDTIGAICFKNLDVTTRLSIVYRVGYEVQVQPGTMLTPLQKLSPPNDDQAISSYFAIARELKDAHPADFNDLGKIWDVISSVGRSVLPTLSPFMGPVGPAAGVALALGDRIRRGLETGRNQPSLADRDAAREALQSVTAKIPKARTVKGRAQTMKMLVRRK
jgi:hypothetical protein